MKVPMQSKDANRSAHPCQRCGSEEWTYVDYGGCSGCRPYEERDEIAEWVAWALTTPLRYGLTTFGVRHER
jgi:hypothetical protein